MGRWAQAHKRGSTPLPPAASGPSPPVLGVDFVDVPNILLAKITAETFDPGTHPDLCQEVQHAVDFAPFELLAELAAGGAQDDGPFVVGQTVQYRYRWTDCSSNPLSDWSEIDTINL